MDLSDRELVSRIYKEHIHSKTAEHPMDKSLEKVLGKDLYPNNQQVYNFIIINL